MEYIFMECLAGCSQLRARLLFLFMSPSFSITIWKLFLKVLDFSDQVFLGTRTSSDIISRLQLLPRRHIFLEDISFSNI